MIILVMSTSPLNAAKCSGVKPLLLTPVNRAPFCMSILRCLVSEPVDWQQRCAVVRPLSVISATDSVLANTATLSTSALQQASCNSDKLLGSRSCKSDVSFCVRWECSSVIFFLCSSEQEFCGLDL